MSYIKYMICWIIVAGMGSICCDAQNTPTPTPSPGTYFPRLAFDTNIASNDVVDCQDILSVGVCMYAQNESERYTLSLNAGGYEFYYPNWQFGTNYQEFLQKPAALGLTTQHIFTFLWDFTFVGDVALHARLYKPNASGWQETDHIQRLVKFNCDVPTPPPQPCRKGHAIVEVTDIPVMTEGNRNSLNKTLLFCLHDEANTNFIGIFHRYLQPDYPEGPWWPTWRLEGGLDDCIWEFNIWDTKDLDGSSATFRIEWEGSYVSVKHLGTGEVETLNVENILGVNLFGASGECSEWGWPSSAHSRLIEMECEELGPSQFRHCSL